MHQLTLTRWGSLGITSRGSLFINGLSREQRLIGARQPTIVEKLVVAIQRALRDPAVQALADKLGLEPTGYGPADLARIQKEDYEQAGFRIKASGFKIDI